MISKSSDNTDDDRIPADKDKAIDVFMGYLLCRPV